MVLILEFCDDFETTQKAVCEKQSVLGFAIIGFQLYTIMLFSTKTKE
jgi:hypothetical protein